MSQPTPEARMMTALDKARTDLGEPLTTHERRLIVKAWTDSQTGNPIDMTFGILHITPELTIWDALKRFVNGLNEPAHQALLTALEQAVATIPKETP